jgi:hypothetical protein
MCSLDAKTDIFSYPIPFPFFPTRRVMDFLKRYERDVLFLVFPTEMEEYLSMDGRMLSHPRYHYVGQLLSGGGYFENMPADTTGGVIMTAKQLGLDNKEMIAYGDLRGRYRLGLWRSYADSLKVFWKMAAVENAIACQLAAWSRRHHALACFGR